MSNKKSQISEIIYHLRKYKSITSMEAIKKFGFNGVPSGDASIAIKKLNSTLKENGVYLVPVGELERFITDVGGHGPDWVNEVLEKYPDLDNEVYSDIKKFIAELNL